MYSDHQLPNRNQNQNIVCLYNRIIDTNPHPKSNFLKEYLFTRSKVLNMKNFFVSMTLLVCLPAVQRNSTIENKSTDVVSLL